MAKVADKYLLVDPWAIVEEGFDKQRNRVSESIFSLANEYMGVRGYPEEGYGGDHLVGSYFNGLFEQMPVSAHYRGVIRSLRYMINAVDWLYTRIEVDGERLDLAEARISGFTRRLDMRSGTYRREFTWHLSGGRELRVVFTRLVSMVKSNLGCQRVEFTPVNFSGTVKVHSGLDFNTVQEDQGRRSFWEAVRQGVHADTGAAYILGKTQNTGNLLYASFRLQSNQALVTEAVEREKFIGLSFALSLEAGQTASFDKLAVNYAEKELGAAPDKAFAAGSELSARYSGLTFDEAAAEQANYWQSIWEQSDIEIDGDPENQQGIRFCIYQLYQTYRGDNPGFNIGAKGLTGEAYRGLAFWDTESYCLPFYLFNNPSAAKSLLEFRYKTLSQAMERAKEVDCQGAFYPIATIDGTESCDLWQHSNLQLHVGTAIAYGIWHYDKIIGDKEFLYGKGLEMLVQISRFYATRGQWGQQSGQYGYYGVMGPDEFQLMVNNNCYTNYMAKKLFEFTLDVIREMGAHAPDQLSEVLVKLDVKPDESIYWKKLADNMKLPYDPQTGIYEEHDGFFDMPHIDIHSIPVEQFPLYSHWSYDRLYRYDMIKQPDVLMFLFLYNQEFPLGIKKANYEYYEPRCIHESSLSPSIHSILAAELGRHDEAYKFFEFATRLDLDNYNRNTREGLHTTSIAAAWMNIVYGFGGLRSDGAALSLAPSIPAAWSAYRFRVQYRGSTLEVKVNREAATVSLLAGAEVTLQLYGQTRTVGAEPVAASFGAAAEIR